ncbi:DNA mismatch repair protein msh6 [Exophiala xenobiotica]|nr:DNA mismatch repair protein msh6 [Exophiala xenobiotica]KAK5392352.1 DNA mismatch repair protein msh6 [Exophiala xenobiotica]KAK5408760.1 DNA mismatch repair protein msh6 [Exophiala xenobiotica]KAK5455658.1 DNA mismatch repair protein msh6 [Exophiala xenobiotica]KAK5473981.1 DNA mismatch repair protein msh6 [Exophiala xenobiotica]
MPRKSSAAPASTPSLKKTPSTGGQKTLLGFFQRTPSTGGAPPATSALRQVPSSPAPSKNRSKSTTTSSASSLTPAPSSDGPGPEDEDDNIKASVPPTKGLPSPVSADEGQTNGLDELNARGTPSRRAKKKTINYLESDSEGTDGDDVFKPKPVSRARPTKRRRLSDSADEDVYEQDNGEEQDEDMEDFIVPDDSEDEVRPSTKRKRPSKASSRKTSSHFTPAEDEPEEYMGMDLDIDLDLDLPEGSTAQKWTYDPENPQPLQPRSTNIPSKKPGGKQKAHMTEPEQRHAWLEDVRDMDRNRPDHPDYDPRTLYIPPMAWAKFSPFEKQYWEIKQKFWDTIVFFKKGKFYELYENDATIGHQLFDLKLTDRVNMRMVGVPESSLGMWANQFVAKGYKIARVDQQESRLAKDMRERAENDENEGSNAVSNKKKPNSKDDKVIKRELACVLTAGTLVDGAMLQDDMATYCVAIKESEIDEQPAFGVAFVDTATGQFHIAQWVDDADLTRFETFVAQTRPQELLLEKGGVSTKTMRILKNNTGLTTIWNHLKPGKEFWEGHITAKEIEACDYFPLDWPEVLNQAKEKDLLMSALGALIQYLRTLKIERDLITMGNFTWYDPIRKASSLVLDGQTLINLELFANSYDGGVEGTLFQLLNRCITPFGKRMFKQWVCHPLMDTKKINARLDAVDSLNADTKVRDRFTSQMTKMPDLERLISRVHAGTCRVQDFVRVLEGFEQIDHTMSLLRDGSGQPQDAEGVIGQLISAMPDLEPRLKYWMDAFDRKKAKDTGVLVPERGFQEDFDNSQDSIEEIQEEFNVLLRKWRKQLGSTAISYRDNGKEIMQLEVPVKVKGIPKNWDQMSATQSVKRYYFPELRTLVRRLQEAQETHSQIVNQVARRFFARFDENYEIWLAAVKIIAQLDCLVSLAKASTSLGYPSCRPEFVEEDDDARSTLELIELRHPCLLAKVDDFIPNDVVLGGEKANISLLTGANAAGKSTVLRMTCIAVIMAQIGCHLPCQSARLTPFDRIMSRLGAQDHIFAAQSTFFVELAETKKILSEATPRSLVILDELGRGTSSHDGVSVAQAVLHHLASHVGCLGFFATHYHSLSAEFRGHPEIVAQRMKILVDDENRRVTFLYKLEEGTAEGSFGMHCASMCGIAPGVVDRAEEAARQWEYTSLMARRLKAGHGGEEEDGGADGAQGGESASEDESKRGKEREVPLGMLSDLAWMLDEEKCASGEVDGRGIEALVKCIEAL